MFRAAPSPAADLDDLAAAEEFLFASYARARRFLRGGDDRTRRPELTARLLGELGNPERDLPCLLIAGSKGKGSTAAFASSLLAASGARVGLFSSPHLLDIRERIRIDGRAIPPGEFVRHVERLREIAEPLVTSLPVPLYISPIGLLLCVALLHFRASGIDVAVVEAGRGARFDDTRLVEHPVAAITRVMLEHTRQLGGSLARIAWHKAGAIGARSTAVSAPQRPAALSALRTEADLQQSRLLLVGNQVQVRCRPRGLVEVITERRRYPDLRPGLRGRHQAENLALALAVAEAFWPALASLSLKAVQRAVSDVRWPGRCEVLQEAPLVLLDGAVNAATARAFLGAARPISQAPIVVIAGAPADKDFRGLFRILGPRVHRLYVTRATNPYLLFPTDAASIASRYARDVVESPSLAAAVPAALADVGTDGTVWIVGTQSLVADALRLWGRKLEQL